MSVQNQSIRLRAISLAALSVVAIVACKLSPEIKVGDQSGLALTLPDTISDFQGTELEISEAEKKILPTDTQFAKKVYRGPDGSTAYYTIVLSGEDRNSIHRPEVCLPGQGWNKPHPYERTIALSDDRNLDVRDLYLEREYQNEDGTKGILRAHYYYWFVGKDVTTPNHMSRIMMTMRDNIVRNINHRWAYVSVMSVVEASEGQSQEEASEETRQLLDSLIRESIDEYQTAF